MVRSRSSDGVGQHFLAKLVCTLRDNSISGHFAHFLSVWEVVSISVFPPPPAGGGDRGVLPPGFEIEIRSPLDLTCWRKTKFEISFENCSENERKLRLEA